MCGMPPCQSLERVVAYHFSLFAAESSAGQPFNSHALAGFRTTAE